MKDGYLTCACASFSVALADVNHNKNEIVRIIKEVSKTDTRLLVFPELCLSGYSIEDLFQQQLVLDTCKSALKEIIEESKKYDLVMVIGMPLQVKNSLYNVAAVIQKGELLAFVPKTCIPTYQEFYEGRRFIPAPAANQTILFNGKHVPFGTRYIFSCEENSNFTFGVEICEDLWIPNSPSISLALNGANIICNPSASNEITTKAEYRKHLVSMQSAKLVCAYLYSSAGNGESSTDIVYSGHHLICENGTVLKESKKYEPEIIYADIDLMKLSSERRKMTTFESVFDYETISFHSKPVAIHLTRSYDPHPFVPKEESLRKQRCEEIFAIQTNALMQRLRSTGIQKVTIGISGGLDSTLALLVTVRAFEQLNIPLENIYAITMPCFGTTSRTKNNATGLMEELGVTSEVINIKESVLVQFKDLKQDCNNHDVTYENVQARTRTEILMNKANQIGGLVIGTGDLSEVALGWSTYNGDHMSMYAVNVSVPKTLIRYLVEYVAHLHADTRLETILMDVLDTPVSPELLPQENDQIVQKTEDIVGPYELHDFFLYHVVRFGDHPKKLLRKTKLAFKDKYSDEIIKKWMRKFYWRFFTQQFKRSCIPDGPKVGSVALSPRGDWRMPSDASVSMWIKEIDTL